VWPADPPPPHTRTQASTRPRAPVGLPNLGGTIRDIRELRGLQIDTSFDEEDMERGMRDVLETSYVSRQRMQDADFDPDAVDGEGLPLVYNEARIAEFWKGRPGELAGRWGKFIAVATPWLTSLANGVLQGRILEEDTQRRLARDAVRNLERLGPTFIKLGQILSIRPDVLPPAIMSELGSLQDRIQPFDTAEARRVVEADLGAPVDEIFSEFSPEPVAAASLAQVYRARVRATGREVAVKVQRPDALATISKALYVMRRAAGVYERIVTRFTAQTTDYQELVSTFAEGLYSEMDFKNEALNALKMKRLLAGAGGVAAEQVVVPEPLLDLTSRRVLTMEWVTGVKLTLLEPGEIRDLARVGQEAFLVQLLQEGFFHGDPHPGNLLKVTEGPDAGKLAILDLGLVAEIPAPDREAMVAATIHLANKNWSAVVEDFVALGFLPADCDRRVIIPVMDRVLSPYLRGGGAKAYNFQALSQELLAVTLEIPFSVPPYMSLLARSVATLEGIALAGDPDYQMVAQAYPFVVRKVLKGGSRGTAAVLREILYDADGNLQSARLSSLLNAALGFVAEETEGFIDLDAVPSDGASTREILAFLLSERAASLRPWLTGEIAIGLDLFMRDRGRKALDLLEATLTPRLPFFGALPAPPPPPLLVPGLGFLSQSDFKARLLPELTIEEQVHLESVVGLAASVAGVDVSAFDGLELAALQRLLLDPSEQTREVADALSVLAEDDAGFEVARDISEQVTDTLVELAASRAQVPVPQLFPWYDGAKATARDLGAAARTQLRQGAASPAPGGGPGAAAAAAEPAFGFLSGAFGQARR